MNIDTSETFSGMVVALKKLECSDYATSQQIGTWANFFFPNTVKNIWNLYKETDPVKYKRENCGRDTVLGKKTIQKNGSCCPEKSMANSYRSLWE